MTDVAYPSGRSRFTRRLPAALIASLPERVSTAAVRWLRSPFAVEARSCHSLNSTFLLFRLTCQATARDVAMATARAGVEPTVGLMGRLVYQIGGLLRPG